MNKHSIMDSLTKLEVYLTEARTADENGDGVDLRSLEGDVLFVLNALPTGADADETLDVKIQDSADNSSFADISGQTAAFTQVTQPNGAKCLTLVLNKDALRRYVRAVVDVGGTTRAFTLSVTAFGIPKYPA